MKITNPEPYYLSTKPVNCKAIYFGKERDAIYKASYVNDKKHDDPAIINTETKDPATAFIKAVANHRVWELEKERNNPA